MMADYKKKKSAFLDYFAGKNAAAAVAAAVEIVAARKTGRAKVPDNISHWEVPPPALMRMKMPHFHVAGHSISLE